MVNLTEEQSNCVNFSISRLKSREPITSLAGPAGAGKTTILKEIVKEFPNIAVVSYTGKACDVLRRKGMWAETVHSLIYRWNEKHKRFFKNDSIDCSHIAIDEASMIGADLFRDLQSFGKPILAVGDNAQLEPVSSKDLNLVKDPDFLMKQIHRQAAGSPIIQLATLIRNRKSWKSFNKKKAKVVSTRPTLAELVKKDIILCGFNKTRVALNKTIRKKLNRKHKIEEGEKIIVLNNDKDLHVFNGQNFIVKEVKPKELLVQDDLGKIRLIPYTDKNINREKTMKWEEFKKYKGNQAVIDYSYAISVHKCVSPETLVETNNGIERIKDISSTGKILSGKEFLSYENKIENPEEDCLKIIFEDGSDIIVTKYHKCEVWAGNEFVMVKADELIQDQFIRKQLFTVNRDGLNAQILPKIDVDELDSRTKVYKTPSFMSEDLAEFLGLVVADGCVFKSGVKLAKRYPEVVQRFCDLAFKLFNISVVKVQRDGFYHAEINSIWIKEWLLAVGGCHPNFKHTPKSVLKSGDNIRRRFLKGLFEDGGVGLKNGKFDHIEWSSSFPKLRAEVRYLLNSLGIICRSVKSKGKCRSYHIYSESAKKFEETIGFISKDKMEKLKLNKAKNRRDLVPLSLAKLELLKEYLSSPDFNNCKRNGYVTRDKLKEAISNGFESNLLDWQYLRIKEIKEVRSTSVCITVPKNNRFNQNGLWWGNSQGSQWKSVGVVNQECSVWDQYRWAYTAATRAEEQVEVWI